ncbi:MAG: YraN family protein [Trueperaceae bacterium]
MTTAATSSREPAHWAERVAYRHLLALGWRPLAVNYRLRGGELDLVFEEGSTVVVVEVRQRKSVRFGDPAETIDARKLGRVRATARHFASTVLRAPDVAMRIDAVVLVGDERRHTVRHLKDVG